MIQKCKLQTVLTPVHINSNTLLQQLDNVIINIHDTLSYK